MMLNARRQFYGGCIAGVALVCCLRTPHAALAQHVVHDSPVITAQPANVTVLETVTANFAVAATGKAPLSYQWRRNGYSVPGQTAARLTWDQTRISDNQARFDVVVSNADGVVTSQVARLTVNRPFPKRVVLFYDDVEGLYNYGRLYVNHLRNILGHFHADVFVERVEDYVSGNMANYDLAIYIGSHFDAPLPAAFIADAALPGVRLAWINFNIWQLLGSAHDTSHLGMHYLGLGNGYDRVAYKGEPLFKGTYDFGMVRIAVDGAEQVYAEAYSETYPEKPVIPYAVRSSNFWYFADNCLADDIDISRSLVLHDLLHEMLETGVTDQPRALVRIEDINSGYTPPTNALAIAELLQNRGIQAAFAVIPRYVDPDGVAGGVPGSDVAMSDDPGFLDLLDGITQRGHILLTHGYTHQNDEEGEQSGDGYEFWNHSQNLPLLSDGWDVAAARVLAAGNEFQESGLSSAIWETPHYEASLVSYHAIAAIRGDWYERLRPYNIFTEGLSRADIEAASSPSPAFQTQYLPYASYLSVYGSRVLPENLNFFSDDWTDIYGRTMNVSNKIEYARQLRVVRDAVASFYFHPHMDMAILEAFLDGLETAGYTFTDAETLLDEMPAGWIPPPKARNDFDGDGRSDIGVYYPPLGKWYMFASTTGFYEDQFGYAGTVPVTGDFDGDGVSDFGVYYAPLGKWYIFASTTGFHEHQFGYAGTIPITGDFDADGKDDFGCYHPDSGTWYVFQSTAGFRRTQFGFSGTIPVTGDFDGDGLCDFGYYHPSSGAWKLALSTGGFFETQFGFAGTTPIVGDFDGDGVSDFGVYYAPLGKWYTFASTTGFHEDQFGYDGTIPVVGDFDGDGRADIGCYYAPGGNWYIFGSSSGFHQGQFGYAGTLPLGGPAITP